MAVVRRPYPRSAALVVFEKKPGRVLNKTWKIGGDDMLCRTVGKRNKETCAKIAALGGNAIKFLKPDGNTRFEAALLEGKQLPKRALARIRN